MRVFILGLIVVFISFMPSVYAIQTGTISVSMPPDSRECFDILLPDNMGVVLAGRYEYRISVYPGPEESWLDLTEITIRTDEDEAVLVPVCFSSVNKSHSIVPATLPIPARFPALFSPGLQAYTLMSDAPAADANHVALSSETHSVQLVSSLGSPSRSTSALANAEPPPCCQSSTVVEAAFCVTSQ